MGTDEPQSPTRRDGARYRVDRRARVSAAAEPQAGVLSRRQVSRLGLTRWEAGAELAAGRWRWVGPQALLVDHCGDPAAAYLWRCVLSVSPLAVLAGLSALIHDGLSGITSHVVHIAAPKSSRPRRPDGVVVHETRRYDEAKLLRRGIPREKPEFAAVHGALWAASDRQAALIIAASVQQRIVAPAALVDAVGTIRRHRRRRLLIAVTRDVCSGAESMGELDFAAMCRARGLPEPDRQVVRRLPSGKAVMDAEWDEYATAAEIDGVGHLSVFAHAADALKQNAVLLAGRRLVRIPVISLRVDPDPFFAQLERSLRQGGWRPTSS